MEKTLNQILWVSLPLQLLLMTSLPTAAGSASELLGSKGTCDDFPIPCAFGIFPVCWMEGFEINFTTTDSTYTLFHNNRVEVLSISLSLGQARMNSDVEDSFYINPIKKEDNDCISWTGSINNDIEDRPRYYSFGARLTFNINDTDRFKYFNSFNGSGYLTGSYPDIDDGKLQLAVGINVGVIIFFILLVICIFIITVRRKLTQLKAKYFQQHGGWLLYEEMRSKQRLVFKIFTKEELEEATNNFDDNTILGRGGYGTVYKGILKDTRVVAIKRSKVINESQKKEFVKEMIILSQINHKNVVKLLGCCLEVEVPMLVYEFVPNGTLFQLIHGKNNTTHVSLQTRLRIAHESAEALAYLHSSASPPIIHGDVKPSNILLDGNYMAKVSDFGASMLAPVDETQSVILVQGTYGYLDPEYLQTSMLTDKSDVYSFGVILLELLTGKKALEEVRSLSSDFMYAMKAGRLLELLDGQIINEEDMGLIEEVAKLAMACISIRGEDRPTMKEVAEELGRLRKLKHHAWVCENPEDMGSLFGESSDYHETQTTLYYSLE